MKNIIQKLMMKALLLFYLSSFIVFCAARSTTFLKHHVKEEKLLDKECQVLISKDLSEPQPLILKSDDEDFLYPDSKGYLTLNEGEKLRVACPGSRVHYKNANISDEATLKCIEGTMFSLMSGEKLVQKKVSLRNVTCASYPSPIIREAEQIDDNLVEYEFGFLTKNNDFYHLFNILHDLSMHYTIFAHVKIISGIKAAQKSFPRKNFKKDGFFTGIPVSNVYQIATQQETLGFLLRDNKLGEKYISGNNYLARGHLIGKADFVYGNQQRGTFSFANCVPMWQSINGGNWKIIEGNVRNFAIQNNVDLDVWTGSLGVLTLKDVNNNDQEIFLFIDENGNVAVPVPKILFKVVYDQKNKEGVVFLTVNNPFLEKLTKDYVVCKNVCDKLDNLSWKPTVSIAGFSYCCSVDDFREVFPELPDFQTDGLLIFET
ncbi:uncharacterized protein [Prorops nasuta]|uniref:uncharacterized protein n=1 Tax=Prorops nasuta TaxID=863751 RepID=UPI0034CD4881